MICFSDLETANETPVSVGSYRYSETVRVQLWAYAADDGPVSVWDVDSGAPMPEDLQKLVSDPNVTFCFHNQGFDRIQLQGGLEIVIPTCRVIDTMVLAYQHGLPGKLKDLCSVFRIPEDLAKQRRGEYLVKLFCKPRPKASKNRWANRYTHPSEWEEYKEYVTHDVLAMREVYKRIKKWNNTPAERELWLLDQKINDRGFLIDLELANGAVKAVEEAKESLAEQCSDATNGAVASATQRDAMLEHIASEHGVALPNMKTDTLERKLEDPDFPEAVKALIRLRLEAASTSVGKYRKVLSCVSSDGRLRGTLQFCGAGRTGRWAGRLVQPQNFPRPKLPQELIDLGIEALKAGCADLLFDNVTELAASAIRGLIVAPPGKKLVVSDLSAIEGRVTAWLAGEHWRIEGFKRYDSGEGFDDYVVTYGRSFNIKPEKVTKAQRQVGKVMVLFLGYQGGVGAFVTGAATYRLNLDLLAEQAADVVSPQLREEAAEFYDWVKRSKGKTYGLSKTTFIICNALVRSWRQANPNIVAMWSGLEDAMRTALSNPGERVRIGNLLCYSEGKNAAIILPSGRYIVYPGMKLDYSTREKGEFTYLGVNQYTRKWGRLTAYGGKFMEHSSQAVARDVLASSMPVAEASGYEILLTVHDELITEAIDSPEYSERELSRIMSTPPPWAKDLPLSASGFESYRYKKAD